MSAFGLGSIRGFLGLDSSDYTKGILDAQVANEVFGHSVTNFVNNPLLGTINLLKGAAVATAQTIKETAALNQEYFRTSQRLGVSTETVSGLQMAYRDMGLQAQEIEKQLAKLAQRVDEAAQGNQTAAAMFDRLGVTVTDATGNLRPLDDILRDVSDGLAGLEDQQQKASLGNQLFGESFVKVSTIIGEGGKAIEETIERTRRFGQVVSDDAARGADKLSSALRDLGFVLEGAKRRLATAFGSGLADELSGTEEALDRLNAKAQSLEGTAEKAGNAFGRWLTGMLEGYEILKQRQEERQQALEKEAQTLNSFESVDRARELLGGGPTGGFNARSIGIPSYRDEMAATLRDYGITEADVIRAAFPHYPDYLAAELEALHRRQEALRAARARR